MSKVADYYLNQQEFNSNMSEIYYEMDAELKSLEIENLILKKALRFIKDNRLSLPDINKFIESQKDIFDSV